MKNKKKVYKVLETVDMDSGQIIEARAEAMTFEREPDFVKLYLTDVTRLYKFSQTQSKLFFSLIRKMNYDNEVVLTKAMRQDIATSLNMPENSFKHAIMDLIGKGIMNRIANNHYFFNPHIIARGSWSDIRKIQMTVTYSKDGRLVRSNFSGQTEIEFR